VYYGGIDVAIGDGAVRILMGQICRGEAVIGGGVEEICYSPHVKEHEWHQW